MNHHRYYFRVGVRMNIYTYFFLMWVDGKHWRNRLRNVGVKWVSFFITYQHNNVLYESKVKCFKKDQKKNNVYYKPSFFAISYNGKHHFY